MRPATLDDSDADEKARLDALGVEKAQLEQTLVETAAKLDRQAKHAERLERGKARIEKLLSESTKEREWLLASKTELEKKQEVLKHKNMLQALQKRNDSVQEMNERLKMAAEELSTRQVEFSLEKWRLSGALEEARRSAAVDSARIAILDQQLSEERRKSTENLVSLERAERKAEKEQIEGARSDAERRLATVTEEHSTSEVEFALEKGRSSGDLEKSCLPCQLAVPRPLARASLEQQVQRAQSDADSTKAEMAKQQAYVSDDYDDGLNYDPARDDVPIQVQRAQSDADSEKAEMAKQQKLGWAAVWAGLLFGLTDEDWEAARSSCWAAVWAKIREHFTIRDAFLQMAIIAFVAEMVAWFIAFGP